MPNFGAIESSSQRAHLIVMLSERQEVPVAVYSGAGRYAGEVIASATDTDFPFVAVISDETGQVVGEFPVRTRADGEAKIVEVLTDLKKIAAEASPEATG